ncbi:MAG: TonB-dependent receptor, partial [Gemmatimonadaceae bacterium]
MPWSLSANYLNLAVLPSNLTRLVPLIAMLTLATQLPSQESAATGSLAGTVTGEAGHPIAGASLQLLMSGGDGRDLVSDARGAFRLSALQPGYYRVIARRIGYREAELPSLRIIANQTAVIRVVLSTSPTQLSTVTVTVSPVSIDATSAELRRRIDVADVKALPMGRDAASLIALVPGARKGCVWGGGGDGANNYQLDGVAVNHPGFGGDFLDPSIDWIETLEIRGLGAGAEYGNFQGGLINAVTKTGDNDWRGTVRTNYVSPSLSGSNIRPNEEGAQQSMRRELSGEVRGPLIHDRLFYFVAGQLIDRAVELADLRPAAVSDFRDPSQDHRDARGIAKLTYAPGPRDRIDALVGRSRNAIDRADFTGIDDVAAARRVSSNTNFYSLSYTRALTGGSFDARIAGFDSRSTRLGYSGDSVPAVQLFSTGRLPLYQNSVFNDRVKPRTLAGNVTWKKSVAVGSMPNEIVVGGDYMRGSWRNDHTRNGGLTWLPYIGGTTGTVDPAKVATWPEEASEWGGEIHLKSDVEDAALFVQDYLTLRPNLTVTPGLRYGRWTGTLAPADGSARFLAARHQAFDPRIGIAWDISGQNTLVAKAHWGRYHQGMNSVFFDRAEGASAYSNESFYFSGPNLTSTRQIFTPAQRDALVHPVFGFAEFPYESILNEAGKVENYRQPYVNQLVLGMEKRFGTKWKAEVVYTNRVNKDIVGLIDRNLDSNYSPIRNVRVRGRIGNTQIYDQYGNELTLDVIYVSNLAVRNELIRRRDNVPIPLAPIPGFTFADIDRLKYDPDIALTTIDDARRRFDQLSISLRTDQQSWNGFGSLTLTRHNGNVDGLTGFTSSGTSFSAGPWVRPNEIPHIDGRLTNYSAIESKLWFGGNLPLGFQGGAFATLSLG